MLREGWEPGAVSYRHESSRALARVHLVCGNEDEAYVIANGTVNIINCDRRRTLPLILIILFTFIQFVERIHLSTFCTTLKCQPRVLATS